MQPKVNSTMRCRGVNINSGYPVEDVTTDCKACKVAVKGKKADPIKVCERIQRKSGRKVELISPLPKPPEENKEENKEENEDKKEEGNCLANSP